MLMRSLETDPFCYVSISGFHFSFHVSLLVEKLSYLQLVFSV